MPIDDKHHSDAHPPRSAHVTPNPRPFLECLPGRSYWVGSDRRVHPSWSMWADKARAPAAAHDRGPARIVSVEPSMAVTFHRKRQGSFAGLSRKTGALVSGLGPHEYAKWQDLETTPNIVTYSMQGIACIWDDHRYTGDWVAHDAALGIVAGEVKADRSYFLDPTYAVTMTHAAAAFAAAGIEFRKETGPQIRGSGTRRLNVGQAFRDRFTAFSEHQEAKVRERLERGAATMDEVERLIGNDPLVGRSVVHAMLCKRVLAFDLNLPVSSATVLTAAPVPSHAIDLQQIDIVAA